MARIRLTDRMASSDHPVESKEVLKELAKAVGADDFLGRIISPEGLMKWFEKSENDPTYDLLGFIREELKEGEEGWAKELTDFINKWLKEHKKTASITDRLDAIAGELEQVDPRWAMAIDQISDKLDSHKV